MTLDNNTKIQFLVNIYDYNTICIVKIIVEIFTRHILYERGVEPRSYNMSVRSIPGNSHVTMKMILFKTFTNRGTQSAYDNNINIHCC